MGSELLDVGGGGYAGGEGYDCYSEEAADHAYESAHDAKGSFRFASLFAYRPILGYVWLTTFLYLFVMTKKKKTVADEVVENPNNFPSALFDDAIIDIKSLIRVIRGQQVMLDRDLARLYQTDTGQLNRQVKRNLDRFPLDFMFQLSDEELEILKCQNGISSWGGDRYFVDDRVLSLLDKRNDNVEATIYTRYNESFLTDLKKHNAQYRDIRFIQLSQRDHDRFLIIDETVYFLGASVKDLKLLFILLAAKLVQVGGGDDAAGKSNYSNAKQTGNHTDKPPDIGHGSYIPITDSSQCNRSPIKSIKEIGERSLPRLRVYVWLGIEHYQRRNENVKNSNPQHSKQYGLLTLDHVAQDLDILGVSDELEKTQYPEQARYPEHLEALSQYSQAWQDGQEVDDGPAREGVD